MDQGKISVGQRCNAIVERGARQAIVLNHTATHLLHAALRQVLGDHVTQKGSLVDAEKLRFDFSHFEPMTETEILEVERIVNDQIRLNESVVAQVMDKEAAMQAGAMALFGEKYGDQVRVLKISDFSTELCGGTHAKRAGDIGLLKIISETGVAAGVRRIEALTGAKALEWVEQRDRALVKISRVVKGSANNVTDKVVQLIDKNRALEKELERLKSKLASSAGGELSSQAVEVEGIKVLAVKLEDIDIKAMRDMVDQLKNKLGSSAIVVAAVKEGKVSLIAGVSKDLISKIKAGDLVNSVAIQVGGKGGGRPDMAQAGGNNPETLDEALKQVPDWVQQQLAARA